MLKILITGATGNLGRQVVRLLLGRQHRVRAYTQVANPSIPQDVEVYTGDLRAGSGLAEATRGVDAIIHTATAFEPGYVTELQGARHLLDAAAENGVPHLLYISIAGVEESKFSYFKAKLEVEKMVTQSSVPWTILRATQFHTFPLQFITSGEDEQAGTITLPMGMSFQSIEMSEVALGLAKLAEGSAAGYAPVMGGPQILTLEEMAESYARHSNKQRVIRTEPLQGEIYDGFRGGVNLAPTRMVGHVTWEEFLQRRA
ncbi:NAD-dependent epimerase/dehydratase family protein [Ktedonosporobacter rubrisoli]|uniref:NAD-dependent epimerase/dehydratase family protein n=1 Tax=Ktedonosporobacter rubrisoli TaxID=2509675 RepID=A0A4P6K311_KTERU|nr:NAD(P)H-binding protein [Ktedonosporobacter rubrisoli]QBD82627.1 NAD-dependent epimerase/dehydratase family protein [Ktedonosporobacter rubrisoli]